MALKRPSFLRSLNELEQEALDRSSRRPASGSLFDHPTAKAVFVATLVITVIAHVIGGIVFVVLGY